MEILANFCKFLNKLTKNFEQECMQNKKKEAAVVDWSAHSHCYFGLISVNAKQFYHHHF